MSQFDELLKSLQAVDEEQKEAASESAAPGEGKDDETIQAAADEAGAGDDVEDDIADDVTDEKPVAKSMKVVGEDGEETEAIDATEILKSLSTRQEQHETALTKALETVVSIAKSQGEVIKSLKADVAKLASAGRGRKTVISVAEKPGADTVAKSMAANEKPAGIKPQELMAKCLSAQKTGALTGLDVARAEVAINNGVAIPVDILNRIQ